MNSKRKIIFVFLLVIVFILSIFTKSIFGKSENDDESNFEEIIISENEIEEKSLKIEKIKVHIIGEVNNPGLVELISGERIADAIQKAGGLTLEADVSKTNLAYILTDGEKVYIPNLSDEENVLDVNLEKSSSKININTASLDELKKIPGVGESTGNSIIEYRKKNGKFILIEDIQNVSGIGPSKFEKMKEYIVTK